MPSEPAAAVFDRSISVSAVPERLEDVHGLLAEAWPDDPLAPSMDRMRFELAVAEVATNVILHARGGDGGPATMHLRVSRDDESCTARFRDDGGEIGLDPLTATMPDADAESGRGLALIREACDEFSYRRVPGGNEWALTCRIRP